MRFIKYMNIVPVAEGYYFLVNGLTGAIDTIDEAGYQICHNWMGQDEINPTDEEENAYQYLLSRGYICEPGEDEDKYQELMDKLKDDLKSKSNMVNLTFLLTYDCNFRCTYCYEQPVLKKGQDWVKQRMDRKMVQSIYDYIDRNNLEINETVIYGGEPLMAENDEALFEILEQSKARGKEVSMATNAYRLPEYTEKLSDYPFNQIQITLDGDRELHNKYRITAKGEGTFDEIIKGIDKASDVGLPIHIRYNVNFSKDQFNQVLIDYLNDKGILEKDNVMLAPAPILGAESGVDCPEHVLRQYLDDIEDLEEIPDSMHSLLAKVHPLASVFYGDQVWNPKYIFCGANFLNRIIDPTGDVYSCQGQVGQEDQAIGKFDGETIHFNNNFDIWRDRNIEKIEKCQDCWAAFICGANCAMDAIANGKKLDEPDCSATENLVDLYLPYLFKRFVEPKL